MHMENKKLNVKIFLNQLPILIIFMEQGHLLKEHTVKIKLIQVQYVLQIMYNLLKKNMLVLVWDKDIHQCLLGDFNKMQLIHIYKHVHAQLMIWEQLIILKKHLKAVPLLHLPILSVEELEKQEKWNLQIEKQQVVNILEVVVQHKHKLEK